MYVEAREQPGCHEHHQMPWRQDLSLVWNPTITLTGWPVSPRHPAIYIAPAWRLQTQASMLSIFNVGLGPQTWVLAFVGPAFLNYLPQPSQWDLKININFWKTAFQAVPWPDCIRITKVQRFAVCPSIGIWGSTEIGQPADHWLKWSSVLARRGRSKMGSLAWVVNEELLWEVSLKPLDGWAQHSKPHLNTFGCGVMAHQAGAGFCCPLPCLYCCTRLMEQESGPIGCLYYPQIW